MMGQGRGVVEEEEEETAASSVVSLVISPENVLRAEAEDEGAAGGKLLAHNTHLCIYMYYTLCNVLLSVLLNKVLYTII